MKNNEMSRQARHDATVRHDASTRQDVTAWNDVTVGNAVARHDGRTWRKFAVAILSLLLFATLTLAIAQVIPAGAADNVLPDNTAEYSFVNDTSYLDTYADSLWRYSRSTNIWESGYDTAQKCLETTLTLKITKGGNVDFQWLPCSVDPVDKGREAYFKVIKASGGSESQIFAHDTAFLYDRYQNHRNVFCDEDPIAVADGDELKFVYKGNYSTNSGYIRIKGLNVPTDKITLIAEVEASSQGHGSIKTEQDGEEFNKETNTLTVQRGYDESVTFTAVPDTGYVAYWRRNDSNAIISVVNDYTIKQINNDDGDLHYVVYFVDENSETITKHVDEAKDGKVGWKETATGFELANLTAGTETFDPISFIYEFVGDRYLSFNYLLLNAGIFDSIVYPEFFIDGKSPASVSLTSKSGEVDPEEVILHIEGKGYHYVEFKLRAWALIATSASGNEVFQVNDLELWKEPPTTQIHVKYNSRLADLYLDDEKQSIQQEGDHVDAILTVPRADEFTIKLAPKDAVRSTLDPNEMASVKWVTGTANAQYGHRKPDDDTQWEYVYPDFKTEADGSVQIKILQKTKLLYTLEGRYERTAYRDSNDFTLDAGEDTLILDLTYKEVAVAPTLTAEKSVDGQKETVLPFGDGTVVDFPFTRVNNFSLSIQKFAGFTTADIGVRVDGEDAGNKVITEGGDGFIFSYAVKNEATITLFYRRADTKDILYSDYSVTFKLRETVEGDINENINHTDTDETAATLSIENDETTQWEFTPAVSEANHYAYGIKAEKEFKNGYY